MKVARTVRIVLVEDNQADVYLVERSLRKHGLDFELVRYGNGDDALGGLCPPAGEPLDPPDIILLDLHLPGTEGIEVLRRIRNDPRLGDVPVVIVSGASEWLKERDLTGANLVVHKSMEVNDYMRDVRNAVLELCPQ